MKKLIPIMMLVMLSGMVMADTCFTVINTPTSTKNYWRAVTYDQIKDNELTGTNWLDRSNHIYSNPGLSVGYQYNLRVDSNCFNNYLLSRNDATGMNSGSLYVQKYNDDYYGTNVVVNSMYTISRQEITSQSISLVRDAGSGMINNVNYLQKPSSFDGTGHAEYYALKEGLCNSNSKITDQLYKIVDKVWDQLRYTNDISCDTGYENIVDCVLAQGQGNSAHYTTLVALLARDCGIPIRIVHGISEGTFDGIDIRLPRDKMHFWIEYYDGTWYTMDVTEDAITGPDNIEVNCIDLQDNDDDGYPDCSDDDCDIVTYCQGEYPSTIDFDNDYSTSLSTLPNAYNIDDLILGNVYGTVHWINQSIDLRNKNVDSALTIQSGRIILNGNIPALAKPSIMTIKSLALDTPVILLNGNQCLNCPIISYDDGILIFNAPGIGDYYAKENGTLTTAETEITLESNPGSINGSNISYLPALPGSTVESSSKLSQPIDKIKSLWTKFRAYDVKIQFGVAILIGFVIWYFFIRGRY